MRATVAPMLAAKASSTNAPRGSTSPNSGTTTSAATPVAVSGLADATSVTAGGYHT